MRKKIKREEVGKRKIMIKIRTKEKQKNVRLDLKK